MNNLLIKQKVDVDILLGKTMQDILNMYQGFKFEIYLGNENSIIKIDDIFYLLNSEMIDGKYGVITNIVSLNDYSILNNVSELIREENNHALKLLNKIEVTDYTFERGVLEYITVADTRENVEVLKNIGASDYDIEDMRKSTFGELDIMEFAYRRLDAVAWQERIGFVSRIGDINLQVSERKGQLRELINQLNVLEFLTIQN